MPAGGMPAPPGAGDLLAPLVDLSSTPLPLPGGLASDNMTHVATIPVDAPGVSAAVRVVDGQQRLYVSGIKGLSIYGVDDPARPALLGTLLLPHSQNEDISVSEDGTRAIVAADGGLPAPNPVTTGLHIIDTSDPAAPRRQFWLDGAGGGTNHTATCADAACDWIYGNRGAIYHVVDDGAGGVTVETLERSWFDHDGERLVTSSHALNRSTHPDPVTGEPVSILISDSTPRLVMDVTNPADPVLLTTSIAADHDGDGLLQHNNLRPNAGQWQPRTSQAEDDQPPSNEARTRAPQRGPADGLPPERADRVREAMALVERPGSDGGGGDPFGGHLRPGELVIGNSESNLTPNCGDNAGGLTIFSIADFDTGAPMEPLHEFRPTNGRWVGDGNPPVNGLGCSGHWFDIQDGDNLIAASWYEHGVKVIEVLPDYSMRQIGFFQPIATEAGMAQWVLAPDGTEYIYSIDYARGIDIIRFDRDAPVASEDQIAEAWDVAAARLGALATLDRTFCRLT